MSALLWVLCFILWAEGAVCVRCFSRFDHLTGECSQELGEVDEEDCCQNTEFAYKEEDGVCRSCGPVGWSQWSSWGPCSVLCGEGVRQKTRKCFGGSRPECPDARKTLEVEPCNATLCCPGENQWLPWGPWGSCSVGCGGGGVRRRDRRCSHPDSRCSETCSGSAEDINACPDNNTTCPVHGGWSPWSDWGACSGSCIREQPGGQPTRIRYRTCSNPTPSSDTVPPGNSCQGDDSDVQICSDLPNCPVDGGWGSWGPPGPCSVSCGEGLQLTVRNCDNPTPKYGGKLCQGPSTRSSVCQHTCPVHGAWTNWGQWADCSGSCFHDDGSVVRRRSRSCSSPAPSSVPPGNGCQGENSQTGSCDHLPHCKVDGGWGSWGPWTSCPVTCGIGRQMSNRKCDSPAPFSGGLPCDGAEMRHQICNTHTHCPVDGVWSDWSSWEACLASPASRKIVCRPYGGFQSRQRECLHRAHGGSICPGEQLSQTRVCFDLSNCNMKGSWGGWSQWSSCNPGCGGGASKRYRMKTCDPDLSAYPATIGRLKEPAHFHGVPLADCGFLPNNERIQFEPCLNTLPCPPA